MGLASFLFLFGPLVLQLLAEFLLVFCNSTELRFELQKFESVGVFFVFSFLKLDVFSFAQFLFLWEGLSSISCFLLFLLYFFFLLYLFFF